MKRQRVSRYYGVRFFILLFGLLSQSLWATGGALHIGLTYRPVFQFINADGDFAGLDVELSQSIFAEAGLSITYEMLPWKRIVHLIETGQLDVALSAADTEERKQYALFSNQPLRLGHNILFSTPRSARKIAGIKSLSELKGIDFDLLVLRGVAYSAEYNALREQDWFRQHLSVVDSPERLIDSVLLERADGFLGSEYEQFEIIKRRGLTKQIIPVLYLMTDQEAQTHIMYSKQSVTPQIVEQVDQAIERLRSNGEYEKILQRYRFRPISAQ